MENNPVQPQQPTQPITPAQPTQTPPPVEPESGLPIMKIGLVILVVLILLTSLGAGYFVLKNSTQKPTPTPVAVATPTPTPSPNPISSPTAGTDTLTDLGNNVAKFSSPTLGISFNFVKSYSNGETMYATRSGSVVCVTSNQNDCRQGQSVEIFSKKPSQSLSDAIKEQFLSGISENDCFVTTSFGKTIISYPHNNNSDVPGWDSPAAQKCPEKYRETNGIRYFYLDPNTPDKFAFFDIGQYAIMGANDNKTPWQDTFKFTQ